MKTKFIKSTQIPTADPSIISGNCVAGLNQKPRYVVSLRLHGKGERSFLELLDDGSFDTSGLLKFSEVFPSRAAAERARLNFDHGEGWRSCVEFLPVVQDLVAVNSHEKTLA